MRIIKNVFKIIIVLFILEILILPTYSKVEAASIWETIFSAGDNFIQMGKNAIGTDEDIGGSALSDDEIQKTNSDIFNILLGAGMVLTVIVGGILGIKFLIASIEEKAKIKEAMIPYIFGCVVIFGALGIWKFVVSVLNQL